MSCLGVLFSLTESEVNTLRSFENDEDRLEYLQEEIETTYFEKFPNRIAELDKSWDAMHRALTDGNLAYDNGTYPLSHVILGGEILYTNGDYIMTLKSPEDVKIIAKTIEKVDAPFLRSGYNRIDEENYGFQRTEDDFIYTLDYLNDSKDFWRRAAEENRYVLFTADQ